MGTKQELVNDMMMTNSDNDDNSSYNESNQIQKSNTHYFKHGYITFRKSQRLQHIHFSVWIWIEDGTKLILKETGIMKGN